ncbi:UNVERIFIED_ORG: hypothetical protein ABIC54_004434 [Burkholderia sp. 1263]
MSPLVIRILCVYGVFALAMLIVVWPMCRVSALADRMKHTNRQRTLSVPKSEG